MRGQLPLEINRALGRAIVPSMAYDGQSDFAAWQQTARAKLGELLGLPFAACDNDLFETEWTKQPDGYTEIRFTFQSEENYFVPAVMWIPDKVQKPMPTAICLQGHSKGMHISLGQPKYEGDVQSINGGDRNFCVRAIQEGCIAIAVEQRCFGERGGKPEPDCTQDAMNAMMIGRTVIGERVWDIERLIDVLHAHFAELVDFDKLICMGNSGGGTATFYAACMDERIRYIMPSCAVCEYDDSILAMPHCPCNYVPNLRRFFEMGDLTGLLAPRPFVLVSGIGDPIFPKHGVRKSFDKATALYAAAHAPENCKLVVGAGEHRFYADDAWPVLKALMD